MIKTTTRPTKSKSQTNALRLRITALRAELTDPICREYPAARRCVEETLAEAEARLAAALAA